MSFLRQNSKPIQDAIYKTVAQINNRGNSQNDLDSNLIDIIKLCNLIEYNFDCCKKFNFTDYSYLHYINQLLTIIEICLQNCKILLQKNLKTLWDANDENKLQDYINKYYDKYTSKIGDINNPQYNFGKYTQHNSIITNNLMNILEYWIAFESMTIEYLYEYITNITLLFIDIVEFNINMRIIYRYIYLNLDCILVINPKYIDIVDNIYIYNESKIFQFNEHIKFMTMYDAYYKLL